MEMLTRKRKAALGQREYKSSCVCVYIRSEKCKDEIIGWGEVESWAVVACQGEWGAVQSLQVGVFQLATRRPIVKIVAAAIVTAETAITTGAYVGGSMKFDSIPSGGVPAGKAHKAAISSGVKLILDKVQQLDRHLSRYPRLWLGT